MPVSAVVSLRPRRRAVVPAAPGKTLYAAVLRATALADPETAAAIHDDEGPSLLAVSALGGPGSRKGGHLEIAPERPCWVRVSSLDDALLRPVLENLRPGGPPLVLEGEELEVTDLFLSPEEHPAASSMSNEVLGSVTPIPRSLTLRFDSPTLLRRAPRDEPFPVPAAVLGSVARRLERAPGAPRLSLREDLHGQIERHVRVGRFELATKVFRGDSRTHLVGFVGTATYFLEAGAPEELRRDLAVLATAARYSGVGAKVTWGMGQCRRTSAKTGR